MSDLFQWRSTWETLHPDIIYEVQVNPNLHASVDEDGQPLFKTIFYSRDFHVARQILVYNTMLLILSFLSEKWTILDGSKQALELLLKAGYSKPPSSTVLLLPHAQLSREEVCNELCRFVEYVLQGDHKMNGTINLILPMRILLDRLPPKSKERAFVLRMLKTQDDVNGFKIVSRIESGHILHENPNICRCEFSPWVSP
jgi:hypothetical protein